MKAVVVGGTGATGRELIAQLLDSPKWKTVVSIARREIDLPDTYKGLQLAKLRQRIINMDNLAAEGQGAFEKADVVFCTLGTTRGKAGSAQEFVRVDLGYVKEAAKLAKEAGVPHFSLLTAQGANPRAWASNFILLHGLLYLNTKGQAEEFVKAQGFPRVSIFRPGLLDRMVGSPCLTERLASKVVSSIKVSQVAKSMMLEAEKSGAGTAVYEMKDLLAAAQKGQAP